MQLLLTPYLFKILNFNARPRVAFTYVTFISIQSDLSVRTDPF